MRLATPFFLLLALPLRAQPVPGDCAAGTASALLDVNEVEARVFDTGSLFFGRDDSTGYQAHYYVPKDTGKSPIFAADLWLGGKVDGELRVAGATYSDFEFWPGPLGDDARPVNPSDCSAYDRIWVVSRQDVARYLATGEATDDLREWPVALGAPVLDGDGVEGNYDLEAGDQPALYGDETAWWVMNDVGNTHASYDTAPLGVEVRAAVFEVIGPRVPASGFPTLGRTTFYRYLVTNRTASAIDSAYVSLFVDPDLGGAVDDYIGTDTLRQMAYVYNADNVDGTSAGYGLAPPAVSFGVVRAPEGLPNGRDDDYDGEVDEPGEELGMTSGMYMLGGGPAGTSDPANATEVYNFMRGRWTNGLPVVECGIGINCGGSITRFAYPGDPVAGTGWNEVSAGTSPGDRRAVVSTGPFRLDPGEAEEVTFAIAYGRGGSNLLSVNVLRVAADEARYLYRTGSLDPTPVSAEEGGGDGPEEPELREGVRLARPHPNPFTGPLTLRYEVPAPTPLRLAVYDALGRAVAVLADGTAEAGAHEATLDGAALAPGVYFVRLAVPGGSRTLAVTRDAR